MAPIVKRILLLAVACALALLASAAAAPGDPKLARMALEPSDLPAGTSLERQRYVRQEGCVSAYERSFDVDGRRYGRTRLLFVDSDLCLFAAVAPASKEMRGWRSFLMSAPRSEIEEIYDDEETDRIRLLRRRTLKVGDGAYEILVRYRFRGETFYSSFTVIRVSRALGYLNTHSGYPIAAGDVTRLAGVFANRMRSGFVPAIVTPPVIAGLAQDGQTLTVSAGTWRNSPTRFGYQWRRCDAAGAACTAIAGAAARTYAVTAADVGSTLRVAVTAHNVSGSSDLRLGADGARVRRDASGQHGAADHQRDGATESDAHRLDRDLGGLADQLRVPVAALRSGRLGMRERHERHRADVRRRRGGRRLFAPVGCDRDERRRLRHGAVRAHRRCAVGERVRLPARTGATTYDSAMRKKLAIVVVALLVVPLAGAATGIKATLKAPATEPRINVKWPYSIKVTNLQGKAIRATLTAVVIDPLGTAHPIEYGPTSPPNPGPPKPITNWPFKGTFRDYIIFPPDARLASQFGGLTLRWTVKSKIGGKTYKKILKRLVKPK